MFLLQCLVLWTPCLLASGSQQLQQSHEEYHEKIETTDELLMMMPTTLLPPPPVHDDLDDDDDDLDGICQNRTNTRYDPLACWLWKQLQIVIPNQEFEEYYVKLQLTDLVCSRFVVRAVDSHYQPSSNSNHQNHHHHTTTRSVVAQQQQQQQLPSLDVKVFNVSATCTGTYHITTGLSGTLTAQVESSPNQPLEWTAEILESSNSTTSDSSGSSSSLIHHPSGVSTTFCDTSSLAVTVLQFAGSISSKLIDLFSGVIKKYVSQALSDQLCPVVRQELDPLLSSYLQQLYQLLLPYLHDDNDDDKKKDEKYADDTTVDASHHPSHRRTLIMAEDHEEEAADNMMKDQQNNNNVVNLYTQAPFLVQTLSIINDLVDTYLQEGILKRWLGPATLSFPSSSSSFDVPNNMVSSSSSCGSFFDGWNGVIRSLLLRHSGDNTDHGRRYFSLPIVPRLHNLQFVIPMIGEIRLDIDEILLEGNGLYSWQKVELLQPNDATQSFQTVLQSFLPPSSSNVTITDSNKDDDIVLTIRPHVNLAVSAADGGMFHGQDLNESFYLHVNLTHLQVATDLAMNIDMQHWPDVTIGTLVQIAQEFLPSFDTNSSSSQLPCLLQAIDSITASNLLAHLQVRDFAVSPDEKHRTRTMSSSTMTEKQRLAKVKLEEDLDRVVNQVSSLFLTEYQPLWTRAIAGLTRGPANDLINDFFTRILAVDDANATCSSKNDDNNSTTTPHYLNFSQIAPLEQFQDLLNQTYTLGKMNEYMQCASNYMTNALDPSLSSSSSLATSFLAAQGRRVAAAFPILGSTTRWNGIKAGASNSTDDDDDADGLAVTIEALELRNAGSIRRIQLFSPTSDGMHLTGGLEFGTTTPMFPLQQRSNETQPELFMGVHLKYPALNISAAQFNVTLLVDKLHLHGGSMVQYDINRLQQFPLGQVLAHGQCTLVPVHALQLLDKLQADLGAFGVIVNASIQTSSSDNNDTVVISIDSEKWPVVQELASSILAWTLNSTRDLVNVATVATQERASDLCAGRSPASERREEEQDSSEDYTSIFLIVTAMILLAQPALLALGRQPHECPLENPYYHDIDDHRLTEPLLDPGTTDIPPGTTEDEKESSLQHSLMHSRHVSEMMRIFVPMLILGSIALLISSNLSIGATVDLKASVGGKSIDLPSLFSFSLFNTADEMWQAGIYALLLLVLVFSGIWPYLKLYLLLSSWVSTPQSPAHVESRGRLLLALDALGKFSLVDAYVLVLFVVAFRYHLALSQESVVDVYVSPQFGFYGFLLATSASLVAGHLLVFYHRRGEMNLLERTTNNDNSNRPIESLLQHSYQVSGGRLGLSRKFRLFLLLLLVLVVGLLCIGVTRRSFIFEFGGLAGMLLGDDSRSTYSLINIGTSLAQSVENPSGAGIRLLQAMYFFYAIIAPFACLVFLFSLLVIPMQLERQIFVLSLAEIANAWSAIEVFCLSIVAALFQISTFASFIIGDKCDILNEVSKDYFDNGESMTCYTVNAAVVWDAVFLLTGVILNSFWVSLVLRMAHSAVGERLRREDQHQHYHDALVQPPQDRMSGFEFCVLAGRRFTAWTVVWADEREHRQQVQATTNRRSPPDREETETSLPETTIPTPPPPQMERGESYGFSNAWREASERDPTFKNWKEADNTASSTAES